MALYHRGLPLIEDSPLKKLVSLAVLFALAASACGGGAVAATVEGVDITVDDVEAIIHSEGETITKARFAEVLGFEIQRLVLVAAAAAEYGVEVSDEDIAARAEQIYEEFSGDGQSLEDFVQAQGLTEVALRNFAHYELLSQQVRTQMALQLPAPSADQISEELNVATWRLTQVCAAHILLETEEEAQAALDRIVAGEDFAAVAVELSTGPSGPNGGDLGCTSPMDYVPTFRDATLVAPIGEVYETIVPSMFGFHVIIVSERTEPDPSMIPAAEDIVSAMTLRAADEIFNPWFFEQLTSAVVTVVERFGSWQTEPEPQVVPPAE